jgi:hypothetical protein
MRHGRTLHSLDAWLALRPATRLEASAALSHREATPYIIYRHLTAIKA